MANELKTQIQNATLGKNVAYRDNNHLLGYLHKQTYCKLVVSSNGTLVIDEADVMQNGEVLNHRSSSQRLIPLHASLHDYEISITPDKLYNPCNNASCSVHSRGWMRLSDVVDQAVGILQIQNAIGNTGAGVTFHVTVRQVLSPGDYVSSNITVNLIVNTPDVLDYGNCKINYSSSSWSKDNYWSWDISGTVGPRDNFVTGPGKSKFKVKEFFYRCYRHQHKESNWFHSGTWKDYERTSDVRITLENKIPYNRMMIVLINRDNHWFQKIQLNSNDGIVFNGGDYDYDKITDWSNLMVLAQVF